MYTHIPHTHLTHYKLAQLINEWVYLTPARVCSRKLNLSYATVALWYTKIRHGIAALPDPAPFSGIVEVDETYVGMRLPSIHATGGYGKVAIFGMKSRNTNQVWATVVPHTDHTVLIPIIQQRVVPGSRIYSDGYGAYYHLSTYGYIHHVVIHEYTYVAQFGVHTNGIESFWAYYQTILRPLRGLPREHYQLHLKEAQQRFNTSSPQKLRRFVRRMLHAEGKN
jgi:transposase-like protein